MTPHQHKLGVDLVLTITELYIHNLVHLNGINGTIGIIYTLEIGITNLTAT